MNDKYFLEIIDILIERYLARDTCSEMKDLLEKRGPEPDVVKYLLSQLSHKQLDMVDAEKVRAIALEFL